MANEFCKVSAPPGAHGALVAVPETSRSRQVDNVPNIPFVSCPGAPEVENIVTYSEATWKGLQSEVSMVLKELGGSLCRVGLALRRGLLPEGPRNAGFQGSGEQGPRSLGEFDACLFAFPKSGHKSLRELQAPVVSYVMTWTVASRMVTFSKAFCSLVTGISPRNKQT